MKHNRIGIPLTCTPLPYQLLKQIPLISQISFMCGWEAPQLLERVRYPLPLIAAHSKQMIEDIRLACCERLMWVEMWVRNQKKPHEGLVY